MSKPTFRFEKWLWGAGYQVVAGVDEVGRGCFAGPVVTGCVVFPNNITINQYNNINKIDDSKKLSALQREKSAKWIKKNSLAWGIGIGTVREINRWGMTKATNSAFRRAVSRTNEMLNGRVDYLLIDAFYIPYIRGLKVGTKNEIKDRKNPKTFRNGSRQLAIIDGDEKSISVAAASIIAKVYRDNLMYQIGSRPKYKEYGWLQNKGYGTKKHQEAIKIFGITNHHRKGFVETYLNNFASSPIQSGT